MPCPHLRQRASATVTHPQASAALRDALARASRTLLRDRFQGEHPTPRAQLDHPNATSSNNTSGKTVTAPLRDALVPRVALLMARLGRARSSRLRDRLSTAQGSRTGCAVVLLNGETPGRQLFALCLNHVRPSNQTGSRSARQMKLQASIYSGVSMSSGLRMLAWTLGAGMHGHFVSLKSNFSWISGSTAATMPP